jgi:glycosyltransferase involved in cell wall biosynthesis
VIASNRGSLPEVVGRAGVLFDPDDADALAQALERVTTDAGFAVERATAGLQQAGTFSWEKAAATLHEAYRDAVGRRRARRETGLV